MLEEVTMYTVGFGRRRVDQLIGILQEQGIQVIIDVRLGSAREMTSAPMSEELRAALENDGLEYHWAGSQLGGNRLSKADSIHLALDDELRGFADYMESAEFHIGLRQLIGIAGSSTAAILFAARNPEKCHRRLIADALMMKGIRVIHLIDESRSREHEFCAELRHDTSELVYNKTGIKKRLH